MSWTQSYYVPGVEHLLATLAKTNFREALELVAKQKGIEIKSVATKQLDDDPFNGPVNGQVVTLKNGKTYVPVLVKKECWGGNEGLDTYAFVEEGSKLPKVREFNDGKEYKVREKKK